MKKSRKKSVRRDRRKAKASQWRRQGKSSMGARVGHGPNGSTPTQNQATKAPNLNAVKAKTRRRILRDHDRSSMDPRLTFSLADVFKELVLPVTEEQKQKWVSELDDVLTSLNSSTS